MFFFLCSHSGSTASVLFIRVLPTTILFFFIIIVVLIFLWTFEISGGFFIILSSNMLWVSLLSALTSATLIRDQKGSILEVAVIDGHDSHLLEQGDGGGNGGHPQALSSQPLVVVDWQLISKNPAYGRHQLSRPIRIVGPIQFGRFFFI